MASDASESYIPQIIQCLKGVDPNVLKSMAGLISDRLKAGNTLMVAGNGGSAASANHLAADLANVLYSRDALRRPRIVSLCESVSRLTAIANDFGYEQVFARQMEHASRGDVILLFSVSGASPNILEALGEARRREMAVISITGRESLLSRDSDYSVIFGAGDYGHAEDFQTIFHHMLKRKLAGESL